MKNLSRIVHRAFLFALSAAFVLNAWTALAAGHEKKQESGNEVILQGEVLDLYCYMKHPKEGQGPGHAKCAKTCIRKGLPIGFFAEGEVYLLIGKDHESAKDLVVDFAGGHARLTGTLIEHHGIKSIEIKSIEKVESPAGS